MANTCTPLGFSVDPVTDGHLQFAAGMWLVTYSTLLSWEPDDRGFYAPGEFEAAARELDEAFGRVAYWTAFSTGAEYLFKGVHLANGLDIRKTSEACVAPGEGHVAEWCRRLRRGSGEDLEPVAEEAYANYGTLGSLLKHSFPVLLERRRKVSPLATVEFESEADIVLGAYGLLRGLIRNRDAHAYVPNVRSQHEFLAADLFAPAFNVLVRWMPGSREAIKALFNHREQLAKDGSRAKPTT